jgi:predicted transposase YbfD/YdcC
VPATSSSLIPLGLSQLSGAAPLDPDEAPHLLAHLAQIPDPRRARGRRFSLVLLLALAASAVLTGARSMAAITEWAADTPPQVRAALGARRAGPATWTVPSEATIRRTLARLDPVRLARVLGTWLTDRGPARRRRAVAVDGKTLRGSRTRTDRAVHLLAAKEHTNHAVLAQQHVNGAPGEVPGLIPLLDGLDLVEVVVTADALHTHADAAEHLVTTHRAHYLFTVKANQPTLLDRCQRLTWHRVPVLARARDRGHGRIEQRTLKVVSVTGLGFPHAAQVIQITRKRRALHARRWKTKVLYAITSLTHAQAGPARLAELLRGHWSIENNLHYVRDVTFAEDHSQVRTGNAPAVMACLRNLVIGRLTQSGPVNIAASLRHHARDPHRPLVTLGIASGRT